MKGLLLLTAAGLLASCTTNSPKGLSISSNNVAVTQSIRFFGPVNDLFPEQRQSHNTDLTTPIVSGDQRFQFPLTQTAQCNKEKTECKHAAVNTWLEFNAQTQANQDVVVTGIFHSELGRSFSVKTQAPGYSQSESLTIPQSVPLIGEVKSDQPFQKTIKLGEVLELKGVADVRAFLEFQ